MLSKSEHKMQQRKELSNTNIRLQMSKYVFSQDLSVHLHGFSKIHCKEPLKIFKQGWNAWIQTPVIHDLICQEIGRIRANHFVGPDEAIMEKMYTSARFYYRKKEKKDGSLKDSSSIKDDNKKDDDECDNNKKDDNKKIYIGFSNTFIQIMDIEIKKIILDERLDDNDDESIKDPIKISQQQMMDLFMTSQIDKIREEIGRLKKKYDSLNQEFVADKIANKMKKAFQNRFYSICKILNGRRPL